MATSLRILPLLVSLAVPLLSCASVTGRTTAPAAVPMSVLPVLGSHLPFPVGSQHLEMTAAASLDPACHVSVGDVVFTVAVAPDGSVKYISTADRSFTTPEGIHVGSPIVQVRSVGASDPLPEAGWGFYARLPSGWYAGFVNGESLSEPPLPSDAVVRWLFKR
jgi:hypothetical protein